MKALRTLLLAGIISLFCCSIGNAQIIYSNAFNGNSTSIYRHVPTWSTNFAGGTSSAWWNVISNSTTSYLHTDGTIGTTMSSMLISFTPRSGYVYTLTASVTVPTMTAGKWITMGFATTNPFVNTAPDPRFGGTLNGNPWTYLTEGSGGDFFFPTKSTTTGNAQLMPAAGTYTVQLVLDTTSSQWTASEFVNGAQVGTTYTYSLNPIITAVGIGQTTLTSNTGIQWNYLTLAATGTGLTNTVNATVSFSQANTGQPLNPAFGGLSYEKLSITNNNYFTSNNVPLVKLFSQVGPAVLRIGGGTVDTTGWNGISNTIPITASEVDRLAGFVNALPTNWSVIYGINLLSNSPANCAAEATYAANALGPRLLGFEIGNEPEFGFSSYSAFLSRWRSLATAITNTLPGWAITNGGIGWTLDDADAGQGQLSAYTDPFAANESGVVSLLTQHFYHAAGGSPNDVMQLLLQPDPFLLQLTTNIVGAAAGHSPLGARITECGSYSSGGTLGVSDVYGAALWSLDYMFTVAANGGQGVNFHGGGRSPYSPLNDVGTAAITQVGPEFYGLKMLSFVPHGNVVPATVTLGSSINFTAYGVRQADGALSVLLNNKEVDDTVAVTVNLGPGVTGAQLIELTSPNMYCTNAYTIGGSAIHTDGTWTGGVQQVLSATNGQLTVTVPPITAILLNPVVPPQITPSVNGNQLTLNWPTNNTTWLLESNSTGLGSANWFPVPGSDSTNSAQVTIQPGQTNVFYRLLSVP